MTRTPSTRPTMPTLRHLEQLMDKMLEGVILMDPAGVILSANPAALAMHGVASLNDLGGTADGYAARFELRRRDRRRLARRDYPLLRLLAGESFPDQIVTVAHAGTAGDADAPQWVHRVRDVVMDVDGGDPDWLALVIDDVSERFDAEDRFEAMFQANPAPALILRIADRRFVLVNQGFLDLSGRTRDEIIGKTLFDFDFLADVDRKAFVRDCVAAGRPLPRLEAELPLAGGGTTLVILAGQPIEVGDQRCLLFTFADLEPRRHAQRALEASERYLASVFAMAPVAMAITGGDDDRIVEVNEAFAQLTGHDPAALVGHVADDICLWEDAAQRRRIEDAVGTPGGVRGEDVRLIRRDGEPADCLVSAERISRDGGACVLWIYQDITARRRGELDLVEAIESVMKDASWLSRSIMDKLATLRNPRGTTGAPQPPVTLTPREREVLDLICQDLDDAAIAQRLGLSRNTVRNHVARLYARIGVNRRSAAVVWAHERGVGT